MAMAPYLTPDKIRDKDRYILDYRILSPEQLNKEFFHRIDCFVFPTRGEGYGLPPVEAMAVGLPVIATNWSGPADYMKESHSYPLNYKLVDMPRNFDANGKEIDFRGYPKDLARDGQQWAEPDVDHLIELMRRVYENRAESKKKGKAAQAYVRRWLTAEQTTKKLISYLDSKF
jgi:glycosyltransferase involved in cell wall biosynthesis